MYNVIIGPTERIYINEDRYFEYTEPEIEEQFKISDEVIDFNKLHSNPVILTP